MESKYQDNQIINDKVAYQIRANFQSLDDLEISDLEEILEKLHDQKDKLVQLPQYQHLAGSIDEDISKLRQILPSTKVATNEEPTNTPNSNISPNPAPIYPQPNNTYNNTTAPAPNNANTPSESNNSTYSDRPRRKKTMLERSLLGQLLFGFRRRSNMNGRNNNNSSNRPTTQNYDNYPHFNSPWGHGGHHHPDDCQPIDRCRPIDKCITGEMDILRLLLLYISFRPRCRYMRVLSDMASNHLTMLNELLENKTQQPRPNRKPIKSHSI